MFVEQLLGHQHEARRAEAALESALFDEGLLDGVEHVFAVEVLDGFHRGAIRKGREIQATGNRAAIDDQGAAAAQSLATAFACAIEAEVVAHHFEQTVMGGDPRRDLLAVEGEGDGAGRGHHASSIGRFSFARSARSTASGLSGNSISRTPTASSMALPMAGDTQKVATSPTPLPPNGPLVWWASMVSFSNVTGRSWMP